MTQLTERFLNYCSLKADTEEDYVLFNLLIFEFERIIKQYETLKSICEKADDVNADDSIWSITSQDDQSLQEWFFICLLEVYSLPEDQLSKRWKGRIAQHGDTISILPISDQQHTEFKQQIRDMDFGGYYCCFLISIEAFLWRLRQQCRHLRSQIIGKIKKALKRMVQLLEKDFYKRIPKLKKSVLQKKAVLYAELSEVVFLIKGI